MKQLLKPIAKLASRVPLYWAAPVVTGLFALAFILCWSECGYHNIVTPAGYAGFITRGSLAGRSTFDRIQYGPTSTGPGWLMHGVNIPLTPRTYTERFEGQDGIVSGDNTRIGFAINVILRVRQDRVKDFVERYTTLHDGDDPEKILFTAYQNNLQQPIRGFVRQAAEMHKGLSIQENMPLIAQTVSDKVRALVGNEPFEVLNITIGKINYPPQITDQVATNLVAQQELLQNKIQITLTEKDAQINVIDAEGIAQAAQITNRSISPRWLQFQAIQAEQTNVASNSATQLFLPVGPMGVPEVLQKGSSKK